MTAPDRPTYLLTLRPLPPVDGEPPVNVRLRRLEKMLLRRDDLRLEVVNHRDVAADEQLCRAALEAAEAVQQHFRTCRNCGADLRGNVWYCSEHADLQTRASDLRAIALGKDA